MLCVGGPLVRGHRYAVSRRLVVRIGCFSSLLRRSVSLWNGAAEERVNGSESVDDAQLVSEESRWSAVVRDETVVQMEARKRNAGFPTDLYHPSNYDLVAKWVVAGARRFNTHPRRRGILKIAGTDSF